MRQKMIRTPLVQYVDETGEPPQVDLLVDKDLRLAFTEKSFNALIQKVSDLTGWDLSPKSEDEPVDVHDLIPLGPHMTPVELMKRCKESGVDDLDYHHDTGVDLQAVREAKGL